MYLALEADILHTIFNKIDSSVIYPKMSLATLKNFDFPHLRMHCFTFGSNWQSGFAEVVKKREKITDRRKNRRITDKK